MFSWLITALVSNFLRGITLDYDRSTFTIENLGVNGLQAHKAKLQRAQVVGRGVIEVTGRDHGVTVLGAPIGYIDWRVSETTDSEASHSPRSLAITCFTYNTHSISAVRISPSGSTSAGCLDLSSTSSTCGMSTRRFTLRYGRVQYFDMRLISLSSLDSRIASCLLGPSGPPQT